MPKYFIAYDFIHEDHEDMLLRANYVGWLGFPITGLESKRAYEEAIKGLNDKVLEVIISNFILLDAED